METTARYPAVILGILMVGGVGAWASSAPVGVSPGSAAGAAIGDPCPTFDWGRVEGAVSYELVVYRVEEGGHEEGPVLEESITGAALGWTPSLGRCLERGEPYAWSVRAETMGGFSDWAAPLFFEVALQPSVEELAAALEIVRRHLATEAVLHDSNREAVGGGLTGLAAAVGRVEAVEAVEALEARAGASPQVSAVAAAGTVGAPAARMTVEGEVRTVDSSGDARIWGRGRKDVDVYARPITGDYCINFGAGGVEFGLSEVSVDWGSVADACPAGTWVCSRSDVVACNTSRPDGSDMEACHGETVDIADDRQRGWIADSSALGNGGAFAEDGLLWALRTCNTLPVWCCW